MVTYCVLGNLRGSVREGKDDRPLSLKELEESPGVGSDKSCDHLHLHLFSLTVI